MTPFAEEIILLHVDEKEGETISAQELNLAEKYLRAYGLKVQRLSKQGSVSEMILEAAHEHAPCMVVMGAFHGNWLQELLSSSVADQIIEDCRVPLFIYH